MAKNPSSNAENTPRPRNRIDHWFRDFANLTADRVGAPSSFALGVLTILIWIASGPFFHFSDTWQLVINTGTTIVTFLMFFLIQNTQTRDTRTMHLKLDELIRAVEGARNHLVDLEHSPQESIDELNKEFADFREAESQRGESGEPGARPLVNDARQVGKEHD